MNNHFSSSKYEALLDALRSMKRIAIAFSGGVDSTFLAYAAKQALGENAVAITVNSPYIPDWELNEAKSLAKSIGIKHQIIDIDQIPDSIKTNPQDRCYLCKKAVFKKIKDAAKGLSLEHVVDGSNFDDTKDYRPGMIALKELDIKSPLLTESWTKDEIRAASKSFELPTHDKPAYACLLTRIPYDTEIEIEALRRIEEAEVFMMGLGFRAVRVRCHGNLARIEVSREDRKNLFDEALLDQISVRLKEIGFTYVTFEASGYSMGSFNQTLSKVRN